MSENNAVPGDRLTNPTSRTKGKGPTGVVINRLNRAQEYRLTLFLDNGRDRIPKAKMGYNAVAEEATQALGFAVSGDNVRNVWRGALDLPPLRTAPQPNSIRSQRAARINHLEARIVALESSLSEAIRRLTSLEQSLGIK